MKDNLIFDERFGKTFEVPTKEEIYDLLTSYIEADEDEDDEDEDDESVEFHWGAEEYHNRAVIKARMGEYTDAVSICKRGAKFFPNDVDLKADIIQYSQKLGDTDKAFEHFIEMKQIPFRKWSWRAFRFVIDFLLEEPEVHEAEIRELISEYRAHFPYDEKCFISESELEAALGNVGKEIDILQKVIQTIPNAPQCALRLADHYYEQGNYEKVVNLAEYGMMASCDIQSTINLPYLCMLATLSRERLLRMKVLQGELITEKDIERLRAEYELFSADPKFSDFENVISERLMGIKLLYVNNCN